MNIAQTVAGCVLLVLMVAAGISAAGFASLHRRRAAAVSATQTENKSPNEEKENSHEHAD